MHLHVNPGAEIPIYRQIVRQVRDAVAAGRLRPEEKLPSHRELAARLVIAPLTVKKAYDELERLGLVETRRGLGSFVAARPPAPRPGEYEARVREAAARLLTEARLAGMPLETLLTLLREMEEEKTP